MPKIKRKTPLMKTVAFDGVPVFYGIAVVLKLARKRGWKGRLNSADRRKGVPEKYGRMSQARLWAGWLRRLPGFNPANPPGRSTHELRSDAVAYNGPVGRPLAWFQLGLDVSEPEQLIRICSQLGFALKRPYPVGSERHHVNFRKSPTRQLRRRGY